MKRCTYCGTEYPDDAEVCVTDGYPLPGSINAEKTASPATESEIHAKKDTLAEEQRVWEKMTFKRFAILFLRIQALWLFFYVAMDSIYLVHYFIRLIQASNYLAEGIRVDIF